MTTKPRIHIAPALNAAIVESQDRIAARYPEAAFAIEDGCDPPGFFLIATVAVPDTDAVFDLVVERLLELQIEEGLPVYVTPIRPIARVIAMLNARGQSTPLAPAPG